MKAWFLTQYCIRVDYDEVKINYSMPSRFDRVAEGHWARSDWA